MNRNPNNKHRKLITKLRRTQLRMGDDAQNSNLHKLQRSIGRCEKNMQRSGF